MTHRTTHRPSTPTATCATRFTVLVLLAQTTWCMTFSMVNRAVPLPNAPLLKAFVSEPTTRTERLPYKPPKTRKKLWPTCKRWDSSCRPLSVPGSSSILVSCITPWQTCWSNRSVIASCCLLQDTIGVVVAVSASPSADDPRAPRAAAEVTRMMTTNGTVANLYDHLFK